MKRMRPLSLPAGNDIEESENVNETAIAIATRASGGLRDRVDLRTR